MAYLPESGVGFFFSINAGSGEAFGKIGDAIRAEGVAVEVPVFGPLFGIFFGNDPVHDYEGAKRSASTARYAPFFRSMLAQGIALAPSAYEVAFPSLAHSAADFERTVEAASVAAKAVAQEF